MEGNQVIATFMIDTNLDEISKMADEVTEKLNQINVLLRKLSTMEVEVGEKVKVADETAPVEEPKQRKVRKDKGKHHNVQIDHGRIIALYNANPPRSVPWIADDLRCSERTVINHLKAEGIYRGMQK